MLFQYDTKWRNAFENLLEASLDKPMTSGDKTGFRPFAPNTTISTWRGPGLDWMLSLQCRGILPPQLPSMYAQIRLPTDSWIPPTPTDHWIQAMARPDFDQLVYEIAATTMPHRVEAPISTSEMRNAILAQEARSDVEEDEFESDQGICPRHADNQSSEDHAYETSLAERYYRDQMSGYGEANQSPHRSPDELGHAVGQAVRQSETGLTELDMYEQLEHAQAVGRARAHARDYRESLGDEGSNVGEAYGAQTIHHYQQQLKILEELNARRVLMARREAESNIGEAARQQAARSLPTRRTAWAKILSLDASR